MHYALTSQKDERPLAKVADVLAVFVDITGICISSLNLKMIGHLGQIIENDENLRIIGAHPYAQQCPVDQSGGHATAPPMYLSNSSLAIRRFGSV